MPHNIADIVIVVDILHDVFRIPLFLVYSEFLSWIFCFLEGCFENPSLLFLWPPPYSAVRQDPVRLFVAHECCSGDDDRDNDRETNNTSKHA